MFKLLFYIIIHVFTYTFHRSAFALNDIQCTVTAHRCLITAAVSE